MKTFIYRLRFKGPTHFGVAGIGMEAVEEILRSDSLYSALLNAVSVLEGQQAATSMVERLCSNKPPFLFSSLMPFGPDPERPEQVAEAVIKPLAPPPVEKPEILRDAGKELKKLKYLRPEDLALWLSEGPLGEEALQGLLQRSTGLTEGWWMERIRPRVALDRQTQNSAYWAQAAIWYTREKRREDGSIVRAAGGLYGLIGLMEESWEERLDGAFRLMGEMGLGGERTYGMGLFEYGGFEDPPERWRNLLEMKGSKRVLLSLFYPQDAEREDLLSSLEAWEIEERRGYITSGRFASGWKRKRVRMLREGTVSLRPFVGKMVDVTPDDVERIGIRHRIYRAGLGFWIPAGGNGK